jgi:hypothetical protein
MMPTIPLYTLPSHPNAWHEVRAPGGYECWRFAAIDSRGDRQVILTFEQGSATDADYLRKYDRYRRRPTVVRPPVPRDWSRVSFALCERGQVVDQLEQRIAPHDVEASMDHPFVRMGASEFRFDGSSYALKVPAMGELTFRPRFAHAAVELTFEKHHWVIAAPLCDVEGDFTGIGYHDHRYGVAPLPREVRRWTSGHVLLDESACAFEQFEPGVTHIVECDASGLHRAPTATRVDSLVHLEDPRAIGSTLIYDARYRDRAAVALCEVVHPQRQRASLLGRILGMSIDKRGAPRT